MGDGAAEPIGRDIERYVRAKARALELRVSEAQVALIRDYVLLDAMTFLLDLKARRDHEIAAQSAGMGGR